MADPPEPESTANTPRWVKVFGIIAIVVALLFVILLVAGGGRHGLSRHSVSDADQTPPAHAAGNGALAQAGH